MNLPHDTELESLIIGSVLMMKKLSAFEKGVTPLDFFHLLNQQIWQTILEFDENGQPIEIFDVAAKVDSPALKASDLSKMTIGIPFADSRFDDIKRLKDLATARRIIHSFRDLAQKASNKEPIIDVLEEAQSVVDVLKVEQDGRTGTSQTLIEVMEYEVFPRLDKFVSGELVKIPFGFEKLDFATNGGASIGELILFGAKPKTGKSVMMLQVARHVASLNLPTYVASLEMLNYENGFRFLAQSSKFSANVFRPNMEGWVADRLKEHARTHYELPIWFDQKSRTIKAMNKEIQRLKDAHGIQAAFIDYAQLIRSDRRSLGRVERIEEAILDLKEMAMKHEIVVYTAAQFNRDGIKSERPTLSDFDGSSAIEKAGNLGLFWTLEKDYDADVDGRKGSLWIELGRSVATDEFSGLVFHGKDARFSLTA